MVLDVDQCWADLKLEAAVKLLIRTLLEKYFDLLVGDQRYGHYQGLVGLQKAGTKFDLGVCTDHCRNGYHVNPTENIYTHTPTNTQETGFERLVHNVA